MSLLHPTTGEMYDRLILLGIKIRRGKEAGKDVRHFQEEADAIKPILGQMFWLPSDLLNELAEVHAQAWVLIETSPPELLRLNARRVAIREEIDKLTGEYRGPEKV